MSRRGTAERWISRINDYRASGERAAAWCARNQVSPKQLYYWMAKLKKADPQAEPPRGPRSAALRTFARISQNRLILIYPFRPTERTHSAAEWLEGPGPGLCS